MRDPAELERNQMLSVADFKQIRQFCARDADGRILIAADECVLPRD
jgi:hypothetical protein